MKNDFFNNNAIKPLTRVPSQSSYSQRNSQFNKTQTKLTQMNKMNPKNFTHREVFNSKLYQTSSTNLGSVPKSQNKGGQKNMKKFFNISLSQKERLAGKLGDQSGLFLKQTKQKIMNQDYFKNKDLEKSWKCLDHYFNAVDKLIRLINPKDPLKIAIKNINQQLQEVLTILFSQHRKSLNKIKEYQLNITSLNRFHDQRFLQSLQESDAINFSCQQSTISKSNDKKAYKDLKLRTSTLEFQNSKLVLLCEKLQDDLKTKDVQLKNKGKQCDKLVQQVKQIHKERQGYEFKIKKLKEELEVAHIVKQQNLSDKVNYILGWKL